MRKKIFWVGISFVAVAAVGSIYNFDAISGQWKFDRICKAQGGSRFYAAAEKDVGWKVEGHDTYDYQWPFGFDHIAFVRYQDKQGVQSDVRVAGYVGPGQRKYIFSPIDESRQIRYKFRFQYEEFPDDHRFGKSLYEVTDTTTGQVIATHTQFSYKWTKPERVILGAPTGVGCWDSQQDIDAFFHGIYALGSKK
jgi:hypothetical protein